MADIEYILVKGKEMEDIIQEVNRMLATGWEPLGGIGVGVNFFYQAMIKRLRSRGKRQNIA